MSFWKIRTIVSVTLSSAVAVVVLTACGETPEEASTSSIGEKAFIRIPDHFLNRNFIEKTGFIRDEKWDDQYAFGYIERNKLQSLSDEAFGETVELDAKTWAHHNFDAKTLTIIEDDQKDEGEVPSEDYHHYNALTEELERLAEEYSDLATLHTAGKSVEGRELWYLKISDNAAEDEGEPKLLYIANMHGDETVGRELMIYLARLLLEKYGVEDRFSTLVDQAQLFIMPSMNPDGFERGNRFNAEGRDLNRSFPDFTSDPEDTPEGRPTETRHVMKLHADHHFLTALNFHGGAVCMNLPWDTTPNRDEERKFSDDPFMFAVSREYADANQTMYNVNYGSFDHGVTYGYEWYSIDGGLQDWASYYRGSIHATAELSSTKYPSASRLPGYWDENRESLIHYLERGLEGLHLNVVNEEGETVTGASVRVNTSRRVLSYDTHQIHKITISGMQTVTVTADGYLPTQLLLESRAFDGSYDDVLMVKKIR